MWVLIRFNFIVNTMVMINALWRSANGGLIIVLNAGKYIIIIRAT